MTESLTDPTTAGAIANSPQLQKRTLVVLMMSVLPAGAASSATFPAATLLADDITGNETVAGFVGVCASLGSALAAVPLARRMAKLGRRPGLRLAYLIAAIGATCGAIASMASGIPPLAFPLLVIGMIAIGGATAANLAARFAAVDLVDESRRARILGFLVWASTFGSVIGPTIGLGWASDLAERVGINEFAGPYVFAALMLFGAAASMQRFLRPDPLVVIDGLTDPNEVKGRAGVLDQFRRIAAAPDARLAVAAMAIGHAVMVGVMTMTPLHMKDGEHEFRIIGFVISLHVVGMYFFSPVVGWLVDRIGPRIMIGVGGLISFAGTEFAARTESHDSAGVFVGLFLIGLGWSFGLIAGSALLTSTFGASERVGIQGAADLAMTSMGVLAGIGAGTVVALRSYHDLGRVAGVIALSITIAALYSLFTSDRPQKRPQDTISTAA